MFTYSVGVYRTYFRPPPPSHPELLKTASKFTLQVQNAVSASQADNVAVVGHPVLTVANAVSAGLADNVVLSPKTTLALASALSASLADNVVLSPKTALVVANAVSAGLADNVVLTAHGAPALGVTDAVSASLADNVAVVGHVVLTVAAATSASQAGNVVLSPKTTLAVANALSATLADNVILAPKTALVVANAVSASQAGSVTVTPRWALTVADAVSLSLTPNVALVNHPLLIVSPAVSLSGATNVILSVPGPIPPKQTATPARIRRVIRECEYARTSNPAVLVARPGAIDGYANIREGFFDLTADAQVLLDELAGILSVDRIREAVESDTPFQLGQSIALTPTIPRAHVIDQKNGIDRTMLIKGVAIDLGADRNSIEVIG